MSDDNISTKQSSEKSIPFKNVIKSITMVDTLFNKNRKSKICQTTRDIFIGLAEKRSKSLDNLQNVLVPGGGEVEMKWL